MFRNNLEDFLFLRLLFKKKIKKKYNFCQKIRNIFLKFSSLLEGLCKGKFLIFF